MKCYFYLKIFPQLFISIILEDKNIVKASIYRGNKLISSNEKLLIKVKIY